MVYFLQCYNCLELWTKPSISNFVMDESGILSPLLFILKCFILQIYIYINIKCSVQLTV